MIVKAPAKINLGLDVIGVRPNGYHEVSMVMQSLALHDRVILEAVGPADQPEEAIEVSCNLPYVPTDSSNLAYKAAAALMSAYPVRERISIHLEKRIPVAAGLAGGSADAAAVLSGLNRLFHLGVSQEELCRIGAGIGADIPFCLMQGTAKAEGIGEILTPLDPMPPCGILLVKPPFSVSTKKVYQSLDAAPIQKHPDIQVIIKALSESDLEALCGSLGNVLEEVTAVSYPIIEELKKAMVEVGAMAALMSGSGPTVYGIFRTADEAAKARDHLRPAYSAMKWIATSPLNRGVSL